MPKVTQLVEGYLMQCLKALAVGTTQAAVRERCEMLLALWEEAGDGPHQTAALPSRDDLPPWARSLVDGLPAGFPGDGAENAGQLGICGDLGGPELEHVLLLGGEIG